MNSKKVAYNITYFVYFVKMENAGHGSAYIKTKSPDARVLYTAYTLTNHIIKIKIFVWTKFLQVKKLFSK